MYPFERFAQKWFRCFPTARSLQEGKDHLVYQCGCGFHSQLQNPDWPIFPHSNFLRSWLKLLTELFHKLLFVFFWTVCQFVNTITSWRLISLYKISTPILPHDINISWPLLIYFHSSLGVGLTQSYPAWVITFWTMDSEYDFLKLKTLWYLRPVYQWLPG